MTRGRAACPECGLEMGSSVIQGHLREQHPRSTHIKEKETPMTEALSPVQEAKTRAEAIEQAPVLFDAVTCRRCGQRFTSREVRDLHLKDCKGEPPAIKRTGITECFHCVHKQVCAVYDLIFAAEERAKRAGVLVHLMRNDCTGYKERY